MRGDSIARGLLMACLIGTGVAALPRCATAEVSSCHARRRAACCCAPSGHERSCRLGCAEPRACLVPADTSPCSSATGVMSPDPFARVDHALLLVATASPRGWRRFVRAPPPARYLLFRAFRL